MSSVNELQVSAEQDDVLTVLRKTRRLASKLGCQDESRNSASRSLIAPLEMTTAQKSTFGFWTEHPVHRAYPIVDRLLGAKAKNKHMGRFKGHHIIHIDYETHFDLDTVKVRLRRSLDRIEWQFVTTGRAIKNKEETVVLALCFGIAPILKKTVSIAYHATRTCNIKKILKQGLLPSNKNRHTTDFPDTEGVIHVCEKLTCEKGENDSAEWWRDHLRQNNRFNDQNWGILKIDMAGLESARVYQDMHSQSGLIADRIRRIPKELIEEVSI
jgi:hypothetical protein